MIEDLIFLMMGLILGYVLSRFIQLALNKLKTNKTVTINTYVIILTTTIVTFISYKNYGLSSLLVKAIFFDCLIIIVSFIDYKLRIIPNKIIMLIIIIGIIISFFDDLTPASNFGGMLVGGGIMFILALFPKVLGGGDIKYMFAIGIFLGIKKIILAIYLSFIIGGIISLIILLLKLKDKKGYIPFGPILSIGSFIVYHFVN